jgi:branched-chain amino acid transport system substrate-binding protein
MALVALAAGGCSASPTIQPGKSTVNVYVSMPLRGPSAPDGQDVADGARMALDAAGGHVGGLGVRAVYLDDTSGSGTNARWSAAKIGANARAATEDSTSIAYIGDFESGASQTSIPITNEAALLQVSPASTAVDLVRPYIGSDQLPDIEQETGERTFGRVIPDDEAQGRAAAGWIQELGATRVNIAGESTEYSKTIADAFRSGLDGVRVTDQRPDALFFALGPPSGPTGDVPPLGRFFHGRAIATDALLPPFTADPRPVVPAGTRFTSAAQDPSQLAADGPAFVAGFRKRYGRQPGRYAAYGYEAMAVVLDSIRRAGGDGASRQAVIDAFFGTTDRSSILGTYSIDPVGNTTLNRLSGCRFAGQLSCKTALRAR